jgi:hypothetical protein
MEEYIVRVYEGRTEWRQNGPLHRTNGPAVECTDGHKLWYQNGQLHRTDGPAVEHLSRGKQWWIKGKEIYRRRISKINFPCKRINRGSNF